MPDGPTSGSVSAGGFEMAYSDEGTGPMVVCLHSGGLTSRQWNRLRTRIGDRFRTILADFIGYGQSSPWPAGRTFDIEHDIALIEALFREVGEPVHLVGHSYGAFLGMKAALRQPERVRSLTLFEPIAFGVLFDGRHKDLVRTLPWDPKAPPELSVEARDEWLHSFVNWWMGDGAWGRLGADARANFKQVAPKLYGEVRSQAEDRTPASAYMELRQPALVLTAEKSPPAARAVAKVVAESMPHARLVDLAGAGHMAPVSNADVVNREIETFLVGLPD